MRVLAFDPGYERLGVAVLEKTKGPSTSLRAGKEVLLYSACIHTEKSLPFAERLKKLGGEAEALMVEWQPDALALEEVFFEKNAKTAMQVAEVRGVLVYLGAKNNLAVHHYTPGEVKIAVTGYGNANKSAVALMVRKILLAAGNPSTLLGAGRLDDELDAIAVGITCLAQVR